MTASLTKFDDHRAVATAQSMAAVPRRASHVLLATDLGPSSAAATEAAIGLARDLDGSLLVMSVVDPVRGGDAGGRMDQIRERRETGVRAITDRARDLGVKTTFLVWQGEPGPSVVAAAEAEAADIIVLGSNGRTRVTKLLIGSVSDHVLRAAHCPVMIVRPADDDG